MNSTNFSCLPAGIKKLKISVSNDYLHPLTDLPHGLQELYIHFFYVKTLDYLPQNLKYLDIRYCKEQDKSNLPNTITKIVLDKDSYILPK